MGLGKLQLVNVQALQAQSYAHLTELREVLTPDSPQNPVQELVNELLEEPYEEIVITNRHHSHPDKGYYVLQVRKDKIRLLETCSVKKIDFKLDLVDQTIYLNGNVIDQSFLGTLQRKLSKVLSDYNEDRVTILGTRKGGDKCL